MNVTNILGISLVEPGQANIETAVNRAIIQIEAATAGYAAIMLGSSPSTNLDSLLPEDYFGIDVPIETHLAIDVQESAAFASRDLIFTPTLRGAHVILNNTQGELVCKYPSDTGVTLAPMTTGRIYCNGTNVLNLE